MRKLLFLLEPQPYGTGRNSVWNIAAAFRDAPVCWLHGAGLLLFPRMSVPVIPLGYPCPSVQIYPGNTPRHRTRSPLALQVSMLPAHQSQPDHLQRPHTGKQLGISKNNLLPFFPVHMDISLPVKRLGQPLSDCRAENFRKKCLCTCIGFFIESILLCVGAFLPRLVRPIPQHTPVLNQVDILRKPSDQMKGFGQAGASL